MLHFNWLKFPHSLSTPVGTEALIRGVPGMGDASQVQRGDEGCEAAKQAVKGVKL